VGSQGVFTSFIDNYPASRQPIGFHRRMLKNAGFVAVILQVNASQ